MCAGNSDATRRLADFPTANDRGFGRVTQGMAKGDLVKSRFLTRSQGPRCHMDQVRCLLYTADLPRNGPR